jgi:AbrB family looped-hinge helix DNA binding protein
MSEIVTLSRKFQISIPKSIYETKGWQAGQKFVFIPRGRGVLVLPVPEAEEFFGLAKGCQCRKLP